MNTSRRILLAGLAGVAVAPTVVAAAPAPAMANATIAEERFARIIAAALAPDLTDAHWGDYVEAARAVLEARV